MPNHPHDSVPDLFIQINFRDFFIRGLAYGFYWFARLMVSDRSLNTIRRIVSVDLKHCKHAIECMEKVLIKVGTGYIFSYPLDGASVATGSWQQVRQVWAKFIATNHPSYRNNLGLLSRENHHVAKLYLIGETP